VICRQAEAVVPAHKTARLQQTGRAQCVLAHQQTRAEADAAGELVRLACQSGANFERRIAYREARTGRNFEPRHQRRIGDSAESAIALRQRVGKSDRWIQLYLTEKWVSRVDSFHFDESGLTVGRARHRAHGGRTGNLATLLQECAFVLCDFALNQREREISAKNDAAFARKAISETRRNRAHAGYRHAAKGNAEDKHVEAVQAAAQLAHCKAQGQPTARRGDQFVYAHEVLTPSTRPERSRTTRAQRAASVASWVT